MKNPNFENILIITNNTKHYLLLKKIFEEFKEAEQQLLWCKSVKEIPKINFDCVLIAIESSVYEIINITKNLNQRFGKVPIIILTSKVDLAYTDNLLDHEIEDVLLMKNLDKFQFHKALSLAYRKSNPQKSCLREKESCKHQLNYSSHNLYKVLFNESSVAQFLCRADDLSIIHSSKKANELSALTGQSVEFIYDVFSAAKDWLIQNIINEATYKSSATIQTVLKPKDNITEPLSLKIKIQRLDNKDYPLVLISCIDITELEKTKEILEKGKNSYQLVLQSTNNVTWEYDIGLDKLEWSENFTSLFGHRSEQIGNITELAEKIHPEDREVTLNGFKKALSGMDQKWHGNYRFQKADGSYAYVFEQCVFIRNREGKAIQAFGALQDVTTKKEREHQLSLMEKVVKSANDPILITEAEQIDGPGPRIVYVNDAFVRQTGYLKEEIIGENPRILQGPKSNKKELARLKKAMEKWHSCQIETINYKKNGEEYWVEFSVVPIANENGRFTNFISIQRQITERKKKNEIKEIFQKIRMAVSQPKDLAGRYDALLKVIMAYTNFKIAEGWIMNIDNSKLNKVITCSKAINFDEASEIKTVFKEAELGKGLPGTAWEKGKITVWEDLKNNPEFINDEPMLIHNLETAVAIPVYHEDSLVGIISLFSQKDSKAITPFMAFFHKISQELGAELLRMKTETELKTIFDLTPNLLFITDYKGIIKKGNLETVKSLNCFITDVVGTSFRDMIPRNHQNKFDDLVKKLSTTNPIVETDIPLMVSDKLKWINLTASLISTDSFIYFVGKDITQHKNLEDLLERTHQIVRMGSWEINVAENKVFWSPMTKELHQESESFEPDIENAINYYKEGYSRNLVKEKIEKAIKGEIKDFAVDAQLITAKGKSIWVRVWAESEWIDNQIIRIFGGVQDINEGKSAEKENAEAKIRYDLASKAATIGIWDWNVKDDLIIWDDTMKALFGVSDHKFTNFYKLWEDALHPDDLVYQKGLLEDVLKRGENYNSQFRIIRADSGETRFIKTIAHVVRNNSGDPLRLVGINYDITDEVTIKSRLEKAKQEREDILESITDGFFAVDKDWVVTYWNKAAEKILNRDRGKIVGKNLWEVYGDAVDLKLFKEYAITMETGTERKFIDYYPTMDIWLEISSFPKENGIVVYFKNITARVKHQQSLAEIRLLQEHVINSTEDLIWAIDNDYKLILANNSFYSEMERISGHKYQLGERVANFTDKSIPYFEMANKFLNDKYRDALAGHQQNITFESKFENKEFKTFQMGLYPIKDNNKTTGAACFARNITDRIKHINAIENQNKKLNEIAWKQSHVVRSPVARIMGLVNLQANMNYNGEELKEIMGYIMDSSLELDQIIRDISKSTNEN